MRSRRTIETGTVQYGLKLISTIRLLMSGDGRSGLPTTAVWRDTATPPSIASMLRGRDVADHEAVRRDCRSCCAAAPGWCASCASRTCAGTLSALSVCSRTMPSTDKPVARLEAAHRRPRHRNRRCRMTPALASRSPAAISRWRSATTLGMAAAEPQPVGSRHLRPAAARHDRLVLRRSPARCAARSRATASAATPSASGWCARRNRNPGRNRRAGSARSAPAARRPGPMRARPARCRTAAAAPCAQAAQEGAPVRIVIRLPAHADLRASPESDHSGTVVSARSWPDMSPDPSRIEASGNRVIASTVARR